MSTSPGSQASGQPGWNPQQPPSNPQGGYPQGQPSAAQFDPNATAYHPQGWSQPQQYGQQGYAQTQPQQPVYPAAGYPQQQYGGAQPYSAVPPGAPKRRGVLFWALVIGIPALLVALAIIGMFVLGQHGKTPATTSPTPAQTSATADAKSADGVKRAFMQAVIDGDADKAMTYLADPPADKTLLTSAVLKHLKDQGNLPTQIVSVDSSGVAVTLKGSNKMYWIDTRKDGDDFKVLGTSTLTGTLSSPIKVAGVSLKPGELNYPMFPGIYDVENDSKFFDIGTVKPIEADPGLGGTEMWYNTPTLTTAGKQAANDAGRKALNDCLAQHKYAPTGCPYGWKAPSDGHPDESTATATLQGANPFDNATWDVNSRGQARANVSFTVKMTVQGTGPDGSPGSWTDSAPETADCLVDLNSTPAKVTWDR